MSHFSSESLPFMEDKTEDQQEVVLGKIERFRGMSEAFVEDLLPFAHIYAKLTKAEERTWATDVPENYTPIGNTYKEILGWSYVGHRAMQKLGAPIVITHTEGDRDRFICNPDRQVAHYVLPDDPSRFILFSLIDNKEQPGFELLTLGVGDRIFPHVNLFDKKSIVSYERIPDVESLKDENLLERHFLFSALRAGVLQLKDKPGLVDRYSHYLEESDRQSLALYEKLRDNDHRPLGPEEVYGIMTSAIVNHIERHPKQDFRDKSQPEDFDLL